MAVEFEVTNLDGVEEAIRKAYVEKDGKFILDPDRYHEIKAEPLQRKNRELLDEKKKLSETTKTLEEKTKSGLGDIEKQLQERDREISGLKNQVREYSIWSPVKDLALKHGVMPDRINAFMTLLRTGERFDMEGTSLIFKDRNGYPTTIPPQRAFEVYLREEEPWAFEASKAGGSGAQNGNRTPGTRTVDRATFNGWTQSQRDAFMTEVAKGNGRLID
jgi:hypothetical protein